MIHGTKESKNLRYMLISEATVVMHEVIAGMYIGFGSSKRDIAEERSNGSKPSIKHTCATLKLI